MSKAKDTTVTIGDGAGITRGLIQASCSGILAGRAVSKRAGKRKTKRSVIV